MVDVISSINSLTLTFIVIAFGYLSMLLGYYLSGKHKEFFGDGLTSIDKMTLSFIIGSSSFLFILVFFLGFDIDIKENFVKIIIYQSYFSVIIAFFISLVLDNKQKE